MLKLSWLSVFLIFSKTISVIENIVPSYKANKFDVLNQDRNSYIIIATDYLTTIYFVKTDFLINSSSYMLFDMNLLKNGFTNRFNEKICKKSNFKADYFIECLMLLCHWERLVLLCLLHFIFSLFYLKLKPFWNGFEWLLCNVRHFECYIKLQFDQVNEKMVLINQNENNFYCKRLF